MYILLICSFYRLFIILIVFHVYIFLIISIFLLLRFELDVTTSMVVGDLKDRIAQRPDVPVPASEIRLVCGGRVFFLEPH